tara:strand:+ start:2018 stop:2800 length:783 start_codon:yes stop_codon:yes gene_type:complete
MIFLSGNLSVVYAWNLVGHKLVAQIAYDYLTPEARKKYVLYNQAAAKCYGARSWLNAAAWLDSYRDKAQPKRQSMHYINLPFSWDNTPLKPPNPHNIIVALNEAAVLLQNPQTTLSEKGFNLRVILHLVGDIHQPLHVATQFSHQFPEGDKGGNRVHLKPNAIGRNLHAYWDNGGGYLKSSKRLKQKARLLEKRYPCHPITLFEPKVWAAESFKLALSTAYTLDKDNKASTIYRKKVRAATHAQIAKAGCRLANWLNAMA